MSTRSQIIKLISKIIMVLCFVSSYTTVDAQALDSLSPSIGYAGQSFGVVLTGSGTSFAQGSGTINKAWLNLGPTQILFTGVSVASIDSITASLSLPGGAASGYYTVNYVQDTDMVDTMFLPNGFLIPFPMASTLTTSNILCNGAAGTVVPSITGGVTPYNYIWSNGATTSSLDVFVDGTYNVTVIDQHGISLTDGGVVLDLSASIGFNVIEGTVYVDGAIVESGQVRLIKKEGNSPNSMFQVDSMAINPDGTYKFSDLAPGDYMVKALGDTALYDAVATWGDSTNHWQDAQIYDLLSSCEDTVTGADIHLITFPTTIGFGTIHGQINQGGNKTGDPVPGVDITLEQVPGGIRDGTTTDDNGEFTFYAVAPGNYIINVDLPGYFMDTLDFLTFDSATTSGVTYDVVVCIDSIQDEIDLCNITATREVNVGYSPISMYPNPFSNQATLFFGDLVGVNVKIFNLNGAVVRTYSNVNNRSLVINRGDLQSGLYILEVLQGPKRIRQIKFLVD